LAHDNAPSSDYTSRTLLASEAGGYSVPSASEIFCCKGSIPIGFFTIEDYPGEVPALRLNVCQKCYDTRLTEKAHNLSFTKIGRYAN